MEQTQTVSQLGLFGRFGVNLEIYEMSASRCDVIWRHTSSCLWLSAGGKLSCTIDEPYPYRYRDPHNRSVICAEGGAD